MDGEDKEDRGWLASVSGDGRINVWDVRVCLISIPLSVLRGNLMITTLAEGRVSLDRLDRDNRQRTRSLRCQLCLVVPSIWL